MAVVVDTADVPPQERSDAWTAANLQVFEPIAVQPRATRPFEGRLVRHELGPLQVLRLSADASIARRTPDLIRSGDPDCVQIMLQLSGACGVAQEDRSSVIREGDLGSWHSSRPYVVEAESPFEMLIVTCPSPLLRPHSDRVRRRTARCIDGSAGMGRLLRLHLTTLLQVLDADACPEAGRAHLAESLFDLILALHAPDDASGPVARQGSRELREQIHRFIDAHLSDPRLDRATIARRHFISRSYLDRLYEHEEVGVSETIRTKRLDRARRDLNDPALAHESVFAVASRWGFVSPSHFSRAFRAAYDESPPSSVARR
jgi:AraC-like DNA-binding protein